MIKEKDKKYWLQLYEVAEEIKKLEPWNYLYDNDILTLVSPNYEYPIFATVMGRAGEFTGIAIYVGQEINDLLNIIKEGYPEHMVLSYQNCFICNYIARDELIPANKIIIKELGLKYRGVWTSFEHFESGYVPSELNIEQVKFLTDILGNFYMTFRAILEHGAMCDFAGGETLLRIYDEKVKLWHTMKCPLNLSLPKPVYPEIYMTDEVFLKRLKNTKSSKLILEMEFLNFIPIPIKGEKGKRDEFARPIIIAESINGMIYQCSLNKKSDFKNEGDYYSNALNIIFEYLLKNGLPSKIIVRDEKTRLALKDSCEKLKIKLEIESELIAIEISMQD
jgi:hypothetical protein